MSRLEPPASIALRCTIGVMAREAVQHHSIVCAFATSLVRPVRTNAHDKAARVAVHATSTRPAVGQRKVAG